MTKKYTDDGDCFSKNGEIFLQYQIIFGDDKEIAPDEGKLVHCIAGLTRPPYKNYVHCYIERDGMAIDKSNGNDVIIPIEVYQALGSIKDENCVRYTRQEVRELILKTERWGPWDSKFDNF